MRFRNPYTSVEVTPSDAPAALHPVSERPPPRKVLPSLRVWRITGTQFLHKRRISAPNKSEARATFKAMLGLKPRDRLPPGHEVVEHID